MREITMGESALLTSPHLFGALVTKDADGKVNVMGISWFTFVSLREGKMLFCTSGKGYTGRVITETGKATFCVVTPALSDKIMQCCRCTGANCDKIAQLGIELTEVPGFDTPVLAGAGVSWSLDLDTKVDAGDHGVYIMKAKKVVCDAEGPYVYAHEGYKRLDTI